MAVNEIAFVEPMMMMLEEGIVTIPAGTIAVIPHKEWSEWQDDNEKDEWMIEDEDAGWRDTRLPKWTLLLAGQSLKRELYPELSRVYGDGGGFYDFTVPNLMKSFVIGIDENHEIQWGDGVIYYQSVPLSEAAQNEKRQREVTG